MSAPVPAIGLRPSVSPGASTPVVHSSGEVRLAQADVVVRAPAGIPGVGRPIIDAPRAVPMPPNAPAKPAQLSLELRSSLEALQRNDPAAYQHALDDIVTDFFATTEDRVGHARALLEATAGPSGVASDIYARIGPQEGTPEGPILTGAELAELGLRLLHPGPEVAPTRPPLDTLPRTALADMAAALTERALGTEASADTISGTVAVRAALLRARSRADVIAAEEDSFAADMRFAFGPADEAPNAIDRAMTPLQRAQLQRLMVGRAESMLASEPSVETLARVHAALAGCGHAVDGAVEQRLRGLAERAKPPEKTNGMALDAVDGVTVRDTAEVPLSWLADGRESFLRANATTMAASLIADTPNIPAPLARAFQQRLQEAIQANMGRGDDATRAITLDVVDDQGDRRVYTYDLQRYRNPANAQRASEPHLHASGLRFASDAGRTRLEAIRTRDDALAYANQVIATIEHERSADRYTALASSQKVAIRDGIAGWFNLAVHHGMPVNPVLRVIDDAQPTTSLNRALNINLETGREQQFWSSGRRARLPGLTSSTRNGDRNGDGTMDWYSNILDRKAFELGHFNLHLYRGQHGRTLQHDGVNPRFQSQWDPQLAAMHVASYVRVGPPVVAGRSNMCDAIEDSPASRAAIVDLDGGQVFRHSLSNDTTTANRWRQSVRRQDYTGRIWRDRDAALQWGAIPDYTPVPPSIYPDLVKRAIE